MIHIYSPKEWHSSQNRFPMLEIDDRGYIYPQRDRESFFDKPIGKIDFTHHQIFGADYDDRHPIPLAYFERSDQLTRIYSKAPDAHADPVLIIRSDQVYTPAEYAKASDGRPLAYLKRLPSKAEEKKENYTAGDVLGIFLLILIIGLVLLSAQQ